MHCLINGKSSLMNRDNADTRRPFSCLPNEFVLIATAEREAIDDKPILSVSDVFYAFFRLVFTPRAVIAPRVVFTPCAVAHAADREKYSTV